MNVRSEIDIRAPRPPVFNVFRDLDRADQHVVGIQTVEILDGPSMLDVGTRWRETRKMMGKAATEEMWVTDLNENSSYSVEAESRGTRYETTYTFVDIPDGTNVTLDFKGTPVTRMAKVIGALGFLFAGATKKMLYADLENLKDACESHVRDQLT